MDNSSGVVVGLVIGGASLVGLLIWLDMLKGRAIDEAKQNYMSALQQVQNSPTSPEARTHALARGRIYAHKINNKQGNTTFDEVAIKNDIDAASARASQPVSPPLKPRVATDDSKPTIEGRLSKLLELKKANVISDSEYDERRKEILREI